MQALQHGVPNPVRGRRESEGQHMLGSAPRGHGRERGSGLCELVKKLRRTGELEVSPGAHCLPQLRRTRKRTPREGI